MLGDTDRYDKIDRYVTDKMTPNERESFVKEMENDPSLRAQLHLVEDIKDGLVRRQEKVEQIQKWQQDSMKEKVKRSNVIRLSTISVAAAVMIGAFISYPTSYHGLQDHGFKTEMQSLSRSTDDFNLMSYWDSKKYEDCLIAIQHEIDSCIDAMANLDSENLPAEEYEGKMESYSVQIDNLKWANIQTLLKMKRYSESLVATEKYISSNGIRKEAATKLQKRLRRKLS